MENKLLILESFAFTLESFKYAEAERIYQESKSATGARDGTARTTAPTIDFTRAVIVNSEKTEPPPALSLAEQVARAREHIQVSLDYKSSSTTNCLSSGGATEDPAMREENSLLKKKVENLENQVKQLADRVSKLEAGNKVAASAPVKAPPPKAAGDSKKPEDDDDVDLFGSDDEEESAEAEALKQKRVAEYTARKAKKPTVIAKSNVILDVKPWDDETNMKDLENAVRSIEMDGLFWGSSKLVPVGYGINKLQIATVVEDEKVSIEELQEKIEAFEDFVQSVDIAAFNKI